MDRVISFPHLGNYYIVFDYFIRKATKCKVIVPPATTKRTIEIGAFVEILPNQEGMIHISQLANQRVNKVTDVVKIGDVVPVKVISIDEQGRINLSLKEARK